MNTSSKKKSAILSVGEDWNVNPHFFPSVLQRLLCKSCTKQWDGIFLELETNIICYHFLGVGAMTTYIIHFLCSLCVSAYVFCWLPYCQVHNFVITSIVHQHVHYMLSWCAFMNTISWLGATHLCWFTLHIILCHVNTSLSIECSSTLTF